MSERWLIAMSGGVDSSVAAALMAKQNPDVVGLTMDLGSGAEKTSFKRCCGVPDAEDARQVARTLGIRHYVANYRKEFREAVVDPFIEEYKQGRTPIPCVACNRVMKFDLLIRRAEALGAVGVSTGHYARIAQAADGEPALYRSVDREKDQTYFLFDLPRAVLPKLCFPLGELKKSEVRALARELKLITADKPESQGICFIPDGNLRGALERLSPDLKRKEGPIVNREGEELGLHSGAPGYTLGQRKGLGLGNGPWYIVENRIAENTLIVDRAPALGRSSVHVRDARWVMGQVPEGPVRVQVRHRMESVAARVEVLEGDDVRIHFETPVWAPADGQAAVVYDADDTQLLGGGWIAGSQ